MFFKHFWRLRTLGNSNCSILSCLIFEFEAHTQSICVAWEKRLQVIFHLRNANSRQLAHQKEVLASSVHLEVQIISAPWSGQRSLLLLPRQRRGTRGRDRRRAPSLESLTGRACKFCLGLKSRAACRLRRSATTPMNSLEFFSTLALRSSPWITVRQPRMRENETLVCQKGSPSEGIEEICWARRSIGAMLYQGYLETVENRISTGMEKSEKRHR